jgi:endoglucanase
MRNKLFKAVLFLFVSETCLLSQPYYYGVNLSCAEFGSALPGTYGKDYTYPSVSSLDYYKSKGLRLIRLPFLWERLQQSLNAPLDSAELSRMDAFVAGISARNMLVLLDAHNYGRRTVGGTSYIISSTQVPVAAFGNFWKRVAAHYKNSNAVWAYGLSNEPHDMGAYSWFNAAQGAIDSIRLADTTHIIMIGGNSWSSADRWPQVSDSLRFLADPRNNLMFEAHQYFDSDASGTYAQTYDAQGANDSIGVKRIAHFVTWLETYNKRGFVGEYGVPGNDSRWNTTLDKFLNYLDQHRIGGTYWGGGPWWGSYALSVEPSGNLDKPQMSVLSKYSGGQTSVHAAMTRPQKSAGPRAAARVRTFRPAVIDVRSAEGVYGVDGRAVPPKK